MRRLRKRSTKAQYLDETSEKPVRLLAWSLLMQKDIEGAKKIYDKIAEPAVQPLDYLNRGHVALAEGDYHAAIGYYARFVKASPDGWQALVKEMAEDRNALLRLGVDEKMLPLVTDAVRYAD